jgi:hypothetical protein
MEDEAMNSRFQLANRAACFAFLAWAASLAVAAESTPPNPTAAKPAAPTAEPPKAEAAVFHYERIPVKESDKNRSETVFNSPSGKLRLELSPERDMATLIDVATGHAIGEPLNARHWKYSCASFSADGKYVAIGLRLDLDRQNGTGATHVGRLEVWDTATGKRVGGNYVRMGPVVSVSFGPDSRTITFADEPRKTSGC